MTQEENIPRRMQEKPAAKPSAAAPLQEKKPEVKHEPKPEVKHDVKQEAKSEAKPESKHEEKREKEKPKRTEAIVRGMDLGISTKHSMAICRFIKGKKIRDSISYLESVAKLKKAMPMKGEIPHRHGMMSGRYPVNASKVFIKLLKSLDANAKSFEIFDPKIVSAKADKASSPHRRFGSRRFKRTHVVLIAKEAGKAEEKKK